MNTPLYARSGIHIRPENKGKFTAYADAHGETVQQAASRVLAHKEDYAPTIVKRANFAHNAAGWHHGRHGMQVPEYANGGPVWPPPSLYWDNNLNGLVNGLGNLTAGQSMPQVSQQNAPIQPINIMPSNTPTGITAPSWNRTMQPPGYNSPVPFSPIANKQAQARVSDPAYGQPIDDYMPPIDMTAQDLQDMGLSIANDNTTPIPMTTPQNGLFPFVMGGSGTPQVNPNDPLGLLSGNYAKQLMPSQSTPTPNPDGGINDLQTILNVGNKLVTAQQGQTPDEQPQDKQGYDYATPYFNLAKFIDSSALLHDMVQGPPPSIQTPLTNMPRVHYDRTIFDQQSQNAKEAGLRGMYEARQQLGQAGDIQNLMLGYNAQQQQAQAQLGTAEREMGMNEQLQNTQIAGQEQQLQDQQNLQEAMTNYQIQAAAQQAKDAAVSHQLSNIKGDYQQEAQYNIAKDAMDEQRAIDKEHKAAQEDIGITGLELQVENMYRNSPEYQTGLLQSKVAHANEVMTSIGTQMSSDQNWQGVYKGDQYSLKALQELPTNITEYKAKVADMTAQQAQAVKDRDAFVAGKPILKANATPADVEMYNTQMKGYEQQLKEHEAAIGRYEQQGKSHATMLSEYERQLKVQQEMDARFNESYDLSGASSKYDEQYRGKSPIFAALGSLKNRRSRQ